MKEVLICWQCGKRAESWHHALPIFTKPKINIQIPLCNICHRMFHITDKIGDRLREELNKK